MKRARILAGVATFAVACALPSTAQAQLGPCPSVQPAPCIITDAKSIALTVQELNHKRQQLASMIEQVKEFTSLTGILGMAGVNNNDPVVNIVKPIMSGKKVTFSDAANALDTALRAVERTQSGSAEGSAEDKLRIRAASGEGYATALALKARINEFDSSYSDLFSRLGASQAQSKPASKDDQLKMCRSMGADTFKQWRANNAASGKASENIEEDWELNNAARLLLLNAYILKREADLALVQLRSVNTVSAANAAAPVNYARYVRTEAGPSAPIAAPQYNIDLGQLMNAIAQLTALKSANGTIEALVSGLAGARQTAAEFDAIKAIQKKIDDNLNAVVASEAKTAGVPVSEVLAILNGIMEKADKTTWDDPSKGASAAAAATQAVEALAKTTGRPVSRVLPSLLAQRAEAYKQAAFFRDTAGWALHDATEGGNAIAEYNKSIGIDATNPAQVNAKIAELEAKVRELSTRLGTAPADIISIRDRIIASADLGATVAQAGQPGAEVVTK